MIEVLGTLIIVIPIIVIFAILAARRGRKKISEMKAYSYHDIATKWSLWDEFVNCWHESVRALRNRKDADEGVKNITKNTHEMDYDTFYNRFTTEQKIEMLIAAFGPEQTK